MLATFTIQTPNTNVSSSHLFIELGRQGISFYVLDDNNTFTTLLCYPFAVGATDDAIAKNINKIIDSENIVQQHFKKTTIFYSFPESILTPSQLMKEGLKKDMLDLVYGETHNKTIRHDLMPTHNLYNVYRVPESIYLLMLNRFPAASQMHLYSVLPDVLKGAGGNHLYCIFNTDTMTVLVLKEGQLQLIQTFVYKTPEDAAYHLLNACQSFEIATDSTTLHVNGTIDITSSLYKALYNYFINIGFGSLPEKFMYADEIKMQPPHFFSHLFSIASCVL